MLRTPKERFVVDSPELETRVRKAIAEESDAMEANRALAQDRLPELETRIAQNVAVVAQLKAAREAAGVSLDEIAARTGMPKSAISRLENSANPNPTLATLRRYAEAIGRELSVVLT